MFSSADLIEALRRRTRRSLRPTTPAGSYPPGWQAWFDALLPRTGAVTGAVPAAVVAEMMKREPLAPAGFEQLGRWRAFAALWRTEWHPRSRDERGDRWLAQGITATLHLVYLLVFAWLLFVRLPAAEAERAAASAGEEVMQVDYITEAIPQVQEAETSPPADTASTSSATPSATPEAAPRTAASDRAQPAAPAPDTPAPPAPSETSGQPLQVTQVAVPDIAFTVPPPRVEPRVANAARPRDVPLPRRDVEVRETPVERAPSVPRTIAVQVPVRAVPAPPTRDIPSPEPAVPVRERAVAVRPVDAPAVRATPREVAARDVPAPPPALNVREAPPREVSAPRATAAAPAVQVREIGVRPRPAPSAASARAPAPASAAAAGTTPAAPARPVATGNAPRAPAASADGTTARASGSPRPGDDWSRPAAGAGPAPGTPGQPGGRSALFNPDGSPRLADGTAGAGGGLPPGTITGDFEQIDRMGTWVKRPGNNYEPTRFDNVWVPHENLLEEWVRKGIRSIEIPVPGTSKRIVCAVSLLQLGGGCGMRDANLNDQEATARPPPDIPWKPELQEAPDEPRTVP